MVRRRALLVAALSLPAMRGSAQLLPAGAPLDFRLEETSGRFRTLTETRGRVTIVFLEDRAHTSDNHEFKQTLRRFLVDNGLLGQVTTYGVADLVGTTGIVRDLVRTAVRAAANQYGIQILMDWDGVLHRAPFEFPRETSTIALFDRGGRLRYRVSGPQGEGAARTAFFRALRHMLREA